MFTLTEKKLNLQRKDLVSWIIFLPTLIILFFSIIPAIFPAFLLTTFGGFENFIGINPFEIGIWAAPLLIINFVLLGIGILYFKNRLGRPITKSIRFIFNFEVSKTLAFYIVIILIGLYILFSIGELFNGAFQADFREHFAAWLEIYSVTDFDSTPIDYHVQFFLETTSMQIFENYKVIPFIASIALLVLTYLFTVEISKKRFAGIVAMVIVLQSNVFWMYDTSVSYPNFWILFYLLSLYLILKKPWPLSPISYVASVLSKPLTGPFLPMTLFFVYRTNLSKKKKIHIVISYGITVAIALTILTIIGDGVPFSLGEFEIHDLWAGFSAVYNAFRFDGIILIFLLPVTVGLFIVSRRGIMHADSIMFLILGMLLSAPLVEAFSTVISVPYRFIPLIVFFAIGTGLLFSKNGIKFPSNEEAMKKVQKLGFKSLPYEALQISYADLQEKYHLKPTEEIQHKMVELSNLMREKTKEVRFGNVKDYSKNVTRNFK